MKQGASWDTIRSSSADNQKLKSVNKKRPGDEVGQVINKFYN